MKKLSFLAMLLLATGVALGQGVGINTATPHNSAMLDVVSTNKGVLIPRMTAAQRGVIASPATGLLVYQTDAPAGFWYYDGAIWRQLTPAGWLLTGNAGTTAGTNFVGTTDAQALTFRTNNLERFRIANGNQVFAMANGTAADPFYSWNTSTNTGLFMPAAGQIGITAAGNYVVNIGAQNQSFGFNRVPTFSIIPGARFFEIYAPCEIGNDGGANPGYQATLGYYRGLHVEISPERNDYGYVGYMGGSNANPAWHRMYSYGFINVSRRELKKNIFSVNTNDALMGRVLEDIRKIKPSFYHYQEEKTSFNGKFSTKYRPHYHLGVIVDEAPDYVLDEAFSGVDGYSLASLSLAGTKYCIEQMDNMTLQDFGSVTLSGTSIDVKFDTKFSEKIKGSIPVVNFTLQDFTDAQLIVANKSDKGFTIKSSYPLSSLKIDWIAFAKSTVKEGSLPTGIEESRLKVPEKHRKEIQNYFFNLKSSASLTLEEK